MYVVYGVWHYTGMKAVSKRENMGLLKAKRGLLTKETDMQSKVEKKVVP